MSFGVDENAIRSLAGMRRGLPVVDEIFRG
jgi:hypothetical protein